MTLLKPHASGGQEPRDAGSLLIMNPMWQNTRKQIPALLPHIGAPCQGVEKRFLDLQKLLIKKFLPRFFQKAGRRRHNSPKKIPSCFI
jgi:hypothetical protein